MVVSRSPGPGEPDAAAGGPEYEAALEAIVAVVDRCVALSTRARREDRPDDAVVLTTAIEAALSDRAALAPDDVHGAERVRRRYVALLAELDPPPSPPGRA